MAIEIKELKIEQEKIDDLNSELSIVFEAIENSFITQVNTTLMCNSFSGNFKEWKEAQQVNRTKLKKDLEEAKNGFKKIVDNSLDETFKSIREIMGIVALIKAPSKEDKEGLKEDKADIKTISNQALNNCVKKSLENYDNSVNKIYQMQKTKPLFEAIYKQTQIGIDKGMKIVYKDGRKMSFKSYMEMNVRTTLRQESNDYLFQTSKRNKVVFYIASYFGDCAYDHKDYQGKYYYDKNWKSFGYDDKTTKQISDTISKYNMKSYQSVVEHEPYLTTRPNCRHQLRPVVLDDIFNKSSNEVLKEYGITKTTYHDKNYKLLQEQRYNERKIRNFKTKLEQDQALYDANPEPRLKEKIVKDKQLIKAWQSRQTKLIKDNDFLKRDYRREDNKVIVNDLGAKYQLGLGFSGTMVNYKVDK